MASIIKNPKDFYSGLLFMAFGLAAVVIGRNYPMGSAVRMGPGYFPTILGWILIVMGGIMAIRGVITRGEPLGGVAVKAMVLVLGAVSFFAGAVDAWGLVVSVSAVVLISSLGNRGFKPVELAGLLLAMLALSVGLFGYGLHLPFKIWPI
ncbi:MAG: tripartite tricarboxylate transporter TctB family protein [Betaproteobacteria bacterium]|nr:tripartite tricarboxylate transporter TctB family protein [Betaproteobacteria bacterium]